MNNRAPNDAGASKTLLGEDARQQLALCRPWARGDWSIGDWLAPARDLPHPAAVHGCSWCSSPTVEDLVEDDAAFAAYSSTRVAVRIPPAVYTSLREGPHAKTAPTVTALPATGAISQADATMQVVAASGEKRWMHESRVMRTIPTVAALPATGTSPQEYTAARAAAAGNERRCIQEGSDISTLHSEPMGLASTATIEALRAAIDKHLAAGLLTPCQGPQRDTVYHHETIVNAGGQVRWLRDGRAIPILHSSLTNNEGFCQPGGEATEGGVTLEAVADAATAMIAREEWSALEAMSHMKTALAAVTPEQAGTAIPRAVTRAVAEAYGTQRTEGGTLPAVRAAAFRLLDPRAKAMSSDDIRRSFGSVRRTYNYHQARMRVGSRVLRTLRLADPDPTAEWCGATDTSVESSGTKLHELHSYLKAGAAGLLQPAAPACDTADLRVWSEEQSRWIVDLRRCNQIAADDAAQATVGETDSDSDGGGHMDGMEVLAKVADGVETQQQEQHRRGHTARQGPAHHWQQQAQQAQRKAQPYAEASKGCPLGPMCTAIYQYGRLCGVCGRVPWAVLPAPNQSAEPGPGEPLSAKEDAAH